MRNKILFQFFILNMATVCLAQEAKDYEVRLCVNSSYTESTLHDGDQVTLSIAGGIPSQTKIEAVQWYAVARTPAGERICRKVSADEEYRFKVSPLVLGWKYADGPDVRSGIVREEHIVLPENVFFYCDILYTYKGYEKTFTTSSRPVRFDVLPELSEIRVLEINENQKEEIDARICVQAANFKFLNVNVEPPSWYSYTDTTIVRKDAGQEESFDIVVRWLENDSRIYCSLHNSYGYVTNEKVRITQPTGTVPLLSDYTLIPVAGGLKFESASPADIKVFRVNGTLCRKYNTCNSLSVSLERGTYIISIRRINQHTITRKITIP